MQSRHTVHRMTADDTEIGHPYLRIRSILHQGNPFDQVLISGVADPDFLNETTVDFMNDFKMSRQQMPQH